MALEVGSEDRKKAGGDMREAEIRDFHRWRRNVWLQTPVGHALACFTRHGVVVHVGRFEGKSFRETATIRLPNPGIYHDGRGWNLAQLADQLALELENE